MLYDRPYFRRPNSPISDWPVVRWIFLVNLGVFLLQNLLFAWFGSQFIEEIFSLSGENLRGGFIWSLLTYGFLHGSLLHFLLNSLLIYLFGRMLQMHLNGPLLLRLYLLSIIAGGVCFLLFHFFSPRILIGASAGVSGLIAFFCLLNYRERMVLFPLPIPVSGKTILFLYLAIDLFGLLFFELAPQQTGAAIAHSSHLGGFLFGCLFFLDYRDGSLKPAWETFKRYLRTRLFNNQNKSKDKRDASNYSFSINLQTREQLKKETDRILDKIKDEGFISLTQEERKTLEKAQKIMFR